MRKPWVITGCALAIFAMGALAQQRAQTGAKQGQTYTSLSNLPDWTGAWRAYRYLNGATARNPDLATETPPLRDPEALARLRELQRISVTRDDNQARQAATAARGGGAGGRGGAAAGGRGGAATGDGAAAGGGGGGRGGFSGNQPLGVVGYLEVLFTPGRVSIVTDAGNVRRIYTNGTVADPTFISANGTSTGHWEGTTLVVDTIGLSPKTTILGVTPAGEGLKIHERIFLKQKDVLEFDTTIDAPQALTQPYHMLPQLFQHDAFKVELLQEYVGETAARDRSVDPVTHSQTFDLTPPSDLPPPPPRK